MASPQWRRGQRSEGHASAKRVRFDLPRVHGQWPGTIRGAEPTAGSSFVVGNYITDKTTLTRLRLHQTHPANDSTPQAAQNLQPNTSFMLRGGSAETMRVCRETVSTARRTGSIHRHGCGVGIGRRFAVKQFRLRDARGRSTATVVGLASVAVFGAVVTSGGLPRFGPKLAPRSRVALCVPIRQPWVLPRSRGRHSRSVGAFGSTAGRCA